MDFHSQDSVHFLLFVAPGLMSLHQSLAAFPPLALMIMLTPDEAADPKLGFLVLCDRAHHVA